MILYEAFDNFSRQKLADGISPVSVRDYFWHCKPLLDALGDCPIGDLSNRDIQEFLIAMQKRNDLSPSSVISYRRSTRIFLKWACQEYDLSDIRLDTIKVRKMPKKEIDLYSADEVESLLSCCESSIQWLTARNRALLLLLLDSGIRRKEASTLLRKDIDFDHRTIVVTGKGRKQRVVPFGRTTAGFIRDYLAICPRDSIYLFCGQYDDRMSNNCISLFFSRLQKKCHFKVSPHRCRHNFATNYCLDVRESGSSVDPQMLQALMGHEDITTTKRYLHDALELTAAQTCPSHLDSMFDGQEPTKYRVGIAGD